MHNHFDKYVNLKQLILDRRPRVVVECGAGNGELTRKIAGLLDVYDFDFHVISDNKVEGLDERVKWDIGVSYKKLHKFKDGEVDFCVLDTDHNYWTLMSELDVLTTKMKEGGLIAMHDIDTFYHDTGMALSYSTGESYPKTEIETFAPYGSLGDALIDFLRVNKFDFKLFAYSKESNGAAVVEKKHQKVFNLFIPGSNPVFVKEKLAVA